MFYNLIPKLSSLTLKQTNKQTTQDLLRLQRRDQKNLHLPWPHSLVFCPPPNPKRGRALPLHCSKPQTQATSDPELQLSPDKSRALTLKSMPLVSRCSSACPSPRKKKSIGYCLPIHQTISFPLSCDRAPCSFGEFLRSSSWYHWKRLLSRKIQLCLAKELHTEQFASGRFFIPDKASKPGTNLPMALQFAQLPSP